MKTLFLAGSLIAAGLILGGCGSSSSTVNTDTTYRVSVSNLTYMQPMSPMAVVLHSDGYKVYQTTHVASEALEKLSEGGDNSALLMEANAHEDVQAAKSGQGLLLPGQSESLEITGTAAECLSIVTMLVNTNDAFTGASCIKVGGLQPGEKMIVNLPTYDAGTEGNSEMASTIPGPAGGGEGFNAVRDDRNFVAIHGGAVTKDDGLTTSALASEHRWDNPTALVTIERL